MSVLRAAKTLGIVSRFSLTQLTMQKMLYVAQMLHLERNGAPAFTEQFEAWDYGPVVRELRGAVAHYRRDTVPDVISAAPFIEGSTQYCAIADAYDLTRHMGTGQLVNLTHRSGGAWEAVYREGRYGVVIPLAAIEAESRSVFQPSDAALAWANDMADEVEATPSRYLDIEGQRAFRARILQSGLQ